MPVEYGHSTPRSDTKHFSKCGLRSLRYCRNYCDWRRIGCKFLNGTFKDFSKDVKKEPEDPFSGCMKMSDGICGKCGGTGECEE